MKFNPGDKHEIHKGLGNPYEIHILAVVDGNQVVYKWYGREKVWWHYEVKRADILEIDIITKRLSSSKNYSRKRK